LERNVSPMGEVRYVYKIFNRENLRFHLNKNIYICTYFMVCEMLLVVEN
jgi:hypothetical protein